MSAIPTKSVDVIDDARAGEMIRSLRISNNLSQTEIAAHLGYSKAYVSDLELGRRGWNEPLFKTIKKAIANLRMKNRKPKQTEAK